MSAGFNRHQQRKQDLAALGRPLVKRARSKCELCESSGIPLEPWEVPPLGEEVSLEAAVMICETCRRAAEGGKTDPDHWRFLTGQVWSEIEPVQVVAVRMARRLAADDVDWARELMDGLYLDPEIEERVNQN